MSDIAKGEYADDELVAIVERRAGFEQEFSLDFDRVWPALGYSNRSHAVRALARHLEGG